MGSWTDPREKPLFWGHRQCTVLSIHPSFFFSPDRITKWNHTAGQQTTDREEHKNAPPCLCRAAVNTQDFSALLSHAAVALWIFLLLASLHIPPTTAPTPPRSLTLSLSPSISLLCAPCCFMLSTGHTDVSLIQATVRGEYEVALLLTCSSIESNMHQPA